MSLRSLWRRSRLVVLFVPVSTSVAYAQSLMGLTMRPELKEIFDTARAHFVKPPASGGAVTVPFRLINGMLAVAATVDGHTGLWLLDTGGPVIWVNREYLQPARNGVGLDTVSVPYVEDSALAHGMAPLRPDWQSDSVTVQLGTISFVVKPGSGVPGDGLPFVAMTAPMTSLYTKLWGFTPLGILGFPATLGAYETVVDYTRQQLTLIPVDRAGRRLVAVPAYTPATTVPFTRASSIATGWYVEASFGGVLDTVHIDTGENFDKLNAATQPRLAGHLAATGQTVFDDLTQEPVLTLDHLHFAGQTYDAIPFSVTAQRDDAFGTDFLRRLGVVGFNFRSRQLILYPSGRSRLYH